MNRTFLVPKIDQSPMLLALLLPAQVFFLTPLGIYVGNLREMNATLFEVVQLCLVPTLFFSLICFILLKYLPGKSRLYFGTSVAMLSVLVWTQGNIIVWDYGVLDGREINWDHTPLRGWIDSLVWLAGISVALIYREQLARPLTVIAISILLVQALALTGMIFKERNSFPSGEKFSSIQSLDALNDFSKKENILHIVVDAFQADVFHYLMDDQNVGDVYRRSFEGFVFYNENLGMYPYTRFAVPGFLSGEIYRNNETKDVYVDRILHGKNILNSAVENGFALDLAIGANGMLQSYKNIGYTNLHNMNHNVGQNSSHADIAMLFDLALFRVTPHLIKPFIYNQQQWFFSEIFSETPGMQHLYFKHAWFLQNMIANLQVERLEPVYKYLHIMNTHQPMVVNGHCQYVGKPLGTTRKRLTLQSKCTLDLLSRLFDKLKEHGIYHSSLIVVHADHGNWVPNYRQGPPIIFQSGHPAPDWVSSLASPLLAIKLPQANGLLRADSTLTSLSQLPATIADVMGWRVDYPGTSLYSNQGKSLASRDFYYYAWPLDESKEDYMEIITRFEVKGSHYKNEWKPVEFYFPPER